MALRFSVGQYYPVDSPVHRLDPRVKVGCGLTIMACTFLIQTPLQLCLGFAYAFALVGAARIPARKLLESVRPIVLVLAFLSLFNLLLVRTGDVLVKIGPLAITAGGAWAAILYSLRVVVAVLAGALMLLTTTPTELTDAFDAALSPLVHVGVPAHELAMVFSLMIRFIPTIADETSAILDAQTSRGGALGEGSVARRVRSIVPVLVALLASSAHHADGLSRALDARCYEGGGTRSHWHPLRLAARDLIAVAITALGIAGLVLLGALG